MRVFICILFALVAMAAMPFRQLSDELYEALSRNERQQAYLIIEQLDDQLNDQPGVAVLLRPSVRLIRKSLLEGDREGAYYEATRLKLAQDPTLWQQYETILLNEVTQGDYVDVKFHLQRISLAAQIHGKQVELAEAYKAASATMPNEQELEWLVRSIFVVAAVEQPVSVHPLVWVLFVFVLLGLGYVAWRKRQEMEARSLRLKTFTEDIVDVRDDDEGMRVQGANERV